MLVGRLWEIGGIYARSFTFYKYGVNEWGKPEDKWDFRDFAEVEKRGCKFENNLVDFGLFQDSGDGRPIFLGFDEIV